MVEFRIQRFTETYGGIDNQLNSKIDLFKTYLTDDVMSKIDSRMKNMPSHIDRMSDEDGGEIERRIDALASRFN